MRRRISSLMAGAAAAMVGAAPAAAQQVADRTVDPPEQWAVVAFWTLIATIGLFIVAAIGYLYRRERGLEWGFQQPEPSHDEDHH